MMYTLYTGMLVFAIILLMSAIFTKVGFMTKTLICGLGMGVFALLALNSYNVTDVYVVGGVATQIVLFESWDADSMASFCLLGFIVMFILFVVNALLSIADYRTPMWKRRMDEHRKSLSDD